MDTKKILLIIDPQYDFIEGGSLPVPGAMTAMVNLAEYLREHGMEYDSIIVTQDEHYEDHCSFKENGGQWPKHCVVGTDGQRVFKPLYDVLMDINYKKEYAISFLGKGQRDNREEYSIIRNHMGAGYIIEQLLDDAYDNVEVEVCGLAGDVCVKNTFEDIEQIINICDIPATIKVLDKFSPCIN